MPGLDEQIDRFLRWGRMVCFQWGLFFFNYITNTWDSGCEWCVKSIRAIEHAHKEDVYVFLSRNTHPVCVKGDWGGLRDNTLVFSPTNNRFTRENRIQTPTNNRFDVVTVSLVGQEKMYDLSSLFHDVSWKDQANPSLTEMVLLWSMLAKQSFTIQEIGEMKIHVMDSDANDHSIQLHDELANRPFTGWSL
jgi:hypothetical protein